MSSVWSVSVAPSVLFRFYLCRKFTVQWYRLFRWFCWTRCWFRWAYVESSVGAKFHHIFLWRGLFFLCVFSQLSLLLSWFVLLDIYLHVSLRSPALYRVQYQVPCRRFPEDRQRNPSFVAKMRRQYPRSGSIPRVVCATFKYRPSKRSSSTEVMLVVILLLCCMQSASCTCQHVERSGRPGARSGFTAIPHSFSDDSTHYPIIESRKRNLNRV